MKKRIISIGIVFFVLVSTTMAFASGTTKVDALITGMKIFFNGKALNGDVITAKGKTYLPMDILSSDLGFQLSADTKNKKFYITEKVSKDSLLKNIDDLQTKNDQLTSDNSTLATTNNSLTSENADLKSQINKLNSDYKAQIDNLNAKLTAYVGTLPLGDGTPITVTLNATSVCTKYYTNGWSSQAPFKVKGKVYDASPIFGFSFSGGYSQNMWAEDVYCSFTFKNDQAKYKQMTFYRAKDDLQSLDNKGYWIIYGKTISGTLKTLYYNMGDLGLDLIKGCKNEDMGNGFNRITVDISGLQEITYFEAPSFYNNNGIFAGTSLPSIDGDKFNYTRSSKIEGQSRESYTVIQGPYVK